MKTLLERLKPEFREILDQEAKLFPSTILALDKELSRNYFVTGITLGTVTHMASVTGLKEHLGAGYYDMFMPHKLQEMFYDIRLDNQD